MNNSFRIKLSSVLLSVAVLTACTSSPSTGSSGLSGPSGSSGSPVAEQPAAQTRTPAEASYSGKDVDVNWNPQDAAMITLNGSNATINGSGAAWKDGDVVITAAGTYVLSGTLDDGQIRVDVAKTDDVHLVLNGVTLHHSESSAIYITEADMVVITVQAGTINTVRDGSHYVFPDASEDEPNAAIFSKGDLTFNGTGTLTVRGNYNNGITSKDDLKIVEGNITVIAADDALMGRDLVAIKDGTLKLEAGGDGIKSTNDEEEGKGGIVVEGGKLDITAGTDGFDAVTSLFISGGELVIDAGDDGIHADAAIAITGGTIDIRQSYEGIESAVIEISGGDIQVVSSDDGINVAGGNDESSFNGRPGQNRFAASSNYKLTISGGSITVNASGDGLDANGSIYMTGGTVLVNGPTSNGNGALDYDGIFEVSGGTLIAAGSAGMAAAPSDTSSQHAVMMYYSQSQAAGTPIQLKDADGNIITEFVPAKNYQSVVISVPELRADASYTFYSNGAEVVSFEITDTVTWLNESGVTEPGAGGFSGRGMGGGMRPGGGMRQGGGRP